MTWGDAARQWNLAYNGETEERPDYEPVPTDMSGADMPSVEQFPPGENVPPKQMDMLDQIGEVVADVARPIVEPFLAGSPTENPVIRGVTEAGLEKIPNAVMSLMNDVEQIIGTVPEGTEATKMPDIVGKSEQYPQAQELIGHFASFLGPFAAMRGFTAPLASLQSFEAGAVADFLMEPGQGGLATMARELGFDNELTQFLDSKVGPEENTAANRLEARVKQAFEGAGVTGVIEGGIKTAMNLFKAGKNYLTKSNTLNTEIATGPVNFNSTYSDPVEIAGFATQKLSKAEGVDPMSIEGTLHKYVKYFAGEPVTGKSLCHSQACESAIKSSKPGDKLVMLRSPKGKSVAHSIIVDKSGKLKFDNMKGEWDSKAEKWQGTNVKGGRKQPMVAMDYYDIDTLKQAASIYKSEIK